MTQINLQELLLSLNGYLHVNDFKDYGPNGLQIEGKTHIKKIAFSTTASLEIIKETIHAKCDALIVHHGLFWDKDSRVLEGPLKEKVSLLLQNQVSLLAYHLPLDAHKEVGNNAKILHMLGAETVHPYEGIGMMAEIHMPKSEFIEKLTSYFQVSPIVPPCTLDHISKVACVSGGGVSYLKSCKLHGIDAFISGTQDEWVWDYAIENNVLFVPIGHYRSETVGIKALCEYVKNRFGVDTVYLESQNPY